MEQKPNQQQPHVQKAPAAHQAPKEEIRYLVRVYNTDLDGKKQILLSMQKITGVGNAIANAILSITKIPKNKKTGTLTDAEVKKLEEALQNIKKYDLPTWMLNRRADPETGEDKHLFMSDLRYQTQNDIKMLQKIRSYKGVRHMTGLTVRGQRTKSNFRKNKGKGMGVKKKTPPPKK